MIKIKTKDTIENSDPFSDLSQLGAAIPEEIQAIWDEKLDELIVQSRPLTTVLLGQFSVGKSSLINAMLTGSHEKPLPVGLKEMTSKSTLISDGELAYHYYPEQTSELEQLSSAALETAGGGEVSHERFQELARSSTETGAIILTHPAPWLRDVQIMDIPGLSGNDPARQAVTRAQVKSADIVLYLISPQGLVEGDLHMLRWLISQGKKLRVLVHQWDRVEAATQRGEEPVTLAQFSAEVCEHTNAELEVVATSARTRQGVDDLCGWIAGLSAATRDIRARRLYAEISPFLTQAQEQRAAELSFMEMRGVREDEDLEGELTNARNGLLKRRAELVEEKTRHWDTVQAQFDQLRQSERGALAQQLRQQVSAVSGLAHADLEREWTLLVTTLESMRTQALRRLIEQGQAVHIFEVESVVSSADASMNSALHFKFPPPPNYHVEELSQAAELELLRSELGTINQLMISAEENEATDQARRESIMNEGQDLRTELQNLWESQEAIYREPPPMREVPGSSTGRLIGKVLGEVADIGMMFVTVGGSAAAKGASVAGKTAKAARAAKTVKQLSTFQKAAKLHQAARQVRNAQRLDQNVVSEDSGAHKALQTIGHLEKLSFSYWGEQLGGLFDDRPRVVVDEVQMQQRRDHTDMIQHQIAQQQRKLTQLDIELNSPSGNQMIKTDRERRRADLERQIKRLHDDMVADEARAQEAAQEQFARTLSRRLDQVISQHLTRYDVEVNGVERHLLEALKRYWDQSVSEALAQHEAHLNQIEEVLKTGPEQRAERIALLNNQRAQIEDFVAQLKVALDVPESL